MILVPRKYHLEVVVNQTHPQIAEDKNVQNDVTGVKVGENGGKVDKREQQRVDEDHGAEKNI